MQDNEMQDIESSISWCRSAHVQRRRVSKN